MPNKEFSDLNFKFSIDVVKSIPKILTDEYKEDMSKIDEELIQYYFKLNLKSQRNYLMRVEEYDIGYCSIFEDKQYWNLYEIFIKEEFRELGLGTKLFKHIKEECINEDKKIRTYTLPSDRKAKNFYESNRITARVLIMEEKRGNSRYRS